MSERFLAFILTFSFLLFTSPSYARTTPEDIINAQRATYNQKLKVYSPQNQQKLKDAEQKIARFNAGKTTILENIMIRQGEILDEYMRRKGLQEGPETDGIHRNLSQPVENARYWLTYAHEAVAYQAAHIYIFNLTGEANIKRDINSKISEMELDLNVLRSKVVKSQKIISELIK